MYSSNIGLFITFTYRGQLRQYDFNGNGSRTSYSFGIQ